MNAEKRKHDYSCFECVITHEDSSIYELEVDDEAKNIDFDEKLRRLKKLCDDGIITRAEFETKKNEILQSKF